MSYQKSRPVRSKELRDSARGQSCTLRLFGCDGGGETTVLAHLPFGSAGMGGKASDLHAIFCCASCHDLLDGRRRDDESYESIMSACVRAHAETMQVWASEGLITVRGAA